MKKKIAFATILSVFILVSVAFITPVNAINLEKASVEGEMHEKLSKISKNVANDGKLQDLIALHDYQEIKEIIKKVLDPKNNENLDALVSDYMQILENKGITDQVVNKFNSMLGSYNSDLSQIRQLVDKIENNEAEPDDYKNYNYYIKSDSQGIKVKRRATYMPLGNAVIVKGADLSVYIPGVGLLDWGEILNKLIAFFTTLAQALDKVGMAILVITDVVGLIGVVLLAFGFERIGTFIAEIFYYLAIVSIIYCYGSLACFVIAMVLMEVSFRIPTSKQTLNVFQRINDRLARMFQRIIGIQKNFRLQSGPPAN